MPPQPPTGTDEDTLDEAEEVTAEPVLGDARPAVRRPGTPAAVDPASGAVSAPATTRQLAVQAAAVAATAVVAGAATTALVRAARGGGRAAGRARGRARQDGVEVLETRTYVVDVHVLGRR
ncbi:hypothetical protein GKE82_21900 [Conexibacter sp. W3-3-2]|uniref:hypothetical protein n=1 Tax=Conexibacter sp. W3-3-2 TaxID=2675227 RepID=UPI0012B74549|nr:hypothetical protein [Conexibacter sp. W3-3-2]MTD46871.1 hypothetical protein [Conexibacter sp. W3-3-2]